MNERCVWGKDEKNWLFDVNPDGSIPEPRKRQKVYPDIPDRTDEVRAAIDAQLKRETGGN